jgi:hypothetical protein
MRTPRTALTLQDLSLRIRRPVFGRYAEEKEKGRDDRKDQCFHGSLLWESYQSLLQSLNRDHRGSMSGPLFSFDGRGLYARGVFLEDANGGVPAGQSCRPSPITSGAATPVSVGAVELHIVLVRPVSNRAPLTLFPADIDQPANRQGNHYERQVAHDAIVNFFARNPHYYGLLNAQGRVGGGSNGTT